MSFLKDLREAYPHMRMSVFLKIYEEHRGDGNKLLEELDKAEAPAVEAQRRAEKMGKEIEERLSASEQHHKLRFVVPADLDLEHVQAVLMYGFLMPGSGLTFIGGRVLPVLNIHKNVRNKLGWRFSEKKYEAAYQYLRKEGIVLESCAAGQEGASLRPRVEKGVSSHGAQILRVALEYALKKRLKID